MVSVVPKLGVSWEIFKSFFALTNLRRRWEGLPSWRSVIFPHLPHLYRTLVRITQGTLQKNARTHKCRDYYEDLGFLSLPGWLGLPWIHSLRFPPTSNNETSVLVFFPVGSWLVLIIEFIFVFFWERVIIFTIRKKWKDQSKVWWGMCKDNLNFSCLLNCLHSAFIWK